MHNLRRQSIDHSDAFQFYIAADARGSRTNYVDDQAWRVNLGDGDEAAIAFQTQYGGRAELVSLTPNLVFADGSANKRFAFAQSPVIRYFAPDFAQVEAAPRPGLSLVARFWAMESQAAGVEFALENRSDEDISLRFELHGQVVIAGRKRRLNVLTMRDGTLALHLGQIGDINPVVALEGAGVEIYGSRISRAKIGRRCLVPAGETLRLPVVVAGLAEMRDSFSLAMNWMSRPWPPYFERIDRYAAAVPRISTGNQAWDRVIDLSYTHLTQALMRPTESLARASFVAYRAGNRGWSRRGDGSDHMRAWAGQDPTLAYLALPALSTIASELAKGLIFNYLETQDESGFIDRQPGLAGQRQGLLMMPLLARMTWLIYQETGDDEFVKQALPGLLAFFGHWLGGDCDADDDGFPEWHAERQMGYVAFPTFGRGQYWAQGADVRQVEGPDLLAYLISEAEALAKLAPAIGDADAERFAVERLKELESRLEELWNGERYVYRDRDTHFTGEAIDLLRDGAGDAAREIDRELPEPARVMIRIVGGVSQRPRVALRIEGEDLAGSACVIEADADQLFWHNRQGLYITEAPLRRIHRIAVAGLSRVYKIYAATIDTSRLDVNALLPLWSGRLEPERAQALIELALDPAHFLRANGLTMVSALDSRFDPSNARGGGGIWMYWLSLVGEGMVRAGAISEATELVQRALAGLARVLEREGCLSQFYHADEARGFGEHHHIGGIAPLHLLAESMGIRIRSPREVRLSGAYGWKQPVSVEQHGVKVERDRDGIRVEFPSGHGVSLPADAPAQLVADPAPEADNTPDLPPAPPPPPSAEADDEERVLIDLDGGERGNTPEPPAIDPTAP